MSASSRARKVQQITSITYQQAKQHLQALSLAVRSEREYVDEIASLPAVISMTCECGRTYFTAPQSSRAFAASCPFCAGVDEMTVWFFEHYEDPANSVPYETAEGGYQYYAGGPYDADEVLQDEFPYVTEKMREAAVERIQQDGYEWVLIGDY